MKNEITLRDIINTVKRRFYIIIFVFIIVFWFVMFIYNILPKTYESYMDIELNLNQRASSSQFESLFNLGNSNIELKSEIEKMKADIILKKIIQDFNMVESKNKSRHIIDRLRGKVYYERDLIEILKEQLNIEPVDGTSILKVSIEKNSPEYAKNIIDTWLKYYKEYRENYQKKLDNEKLEQLNSVLERVENNLDEISKKALDFELKNKITEENPLMDKYYDVVKRLYQYEEEKNSLDIRVKNFENVYLNIDPDMKELYLTEKNQEIKNLKIQLENSQYEYETIKILSPNSPQLIELKTKIDVLKSQLEKKLNAIIDNEEIYLTSISPELLNEYKELKYSYEFLDTKYNMLSNLEKELSKKIADQSPIMYEYLKLKKEQKVLEEKYEIIKNTIEQITINNIINKEQIRVINDSFTPTRPIFPSFKMFFIGGFLLAIFMGSIVALKFELKDKKVHSLEDFKYNYKEPELVIKNSDEIENISKYIYMLNKNNLLIVNTSIKKEELLDILYNELSKLDYNVINIKKLDLDKIREIEEKISKEKIITILNTDNKNDFNILKSKFEETVFIVLNKKSKMHFFDSDARIIYIRSV